MTDPHEAYRESVARIEDVLVRAEEIDGLVAVTQAPGGVLPDGGGGERDYRTTFATNPDGDMDQLAALGALLFNVAQLRGMHPAVVGHMMIENAMDFADGME